MATTAKLVSSELKTITGASHEGVANVRCYIEDDNVLASGITVDAALINAGVEEVGGATGTHEGLAASVEYVEVLNGGYSQDASTFWLYDEVAGTLKAYASPGGAAATGDLSAVAKRPYCNVRCTRTP